MKKELEKRIKELEVDRKYAYGNEMWQRQDKERLEFLKKLYDALYGY